MNNLINKLNDGLSKRSTQIVLILVLFFGYLVVSVFAFTEPTSPPPAGNVAAPINVSGSAQTKSGDLTVVDLYANNWFHNNKVGDGLINGATGGRFYSASTNYWYLFSNRGLQVYNNSGTRQGYLYHNNNGSFGLLSPGGSWRVRVDNSNVQLYGGVRLNSTKSCSGKLFTNSSGQILCGTDSGITSETDPTVQSWAKTSSPTIPGITTTAGGLIIETRTSDPASPATGQIWLRTDL